MLVVGNIALERDFYVIECRRSCSYSIHRLNVCWASKSQRTPSIIHTETYRTVCRDEKGTVCLNALLFQITYRQPPRNLSLLCTPWCGNALFLFSCNHHSNSQARRPATHSIHPLTLSLRNSFPRCYRLCVAWYAFRQRVGISTHKVSCNLGIAHYRNEVFRSRSFLRVSSVLDQSFCGISLSQGSAVLRSTRFLRYCNSPYCFRKSKRKFLTGYNPVGTNVRSNIDAASS